MLKRIGLFACELVSVVFATTLALLLRDNFETSNDQLVAFIPYLTTTVVIAAAALTIMGLNRSVWRLSVMSDYLRIVGGAILTVSVTMAIGFLSNRLQNVSRALPVIQLILMISALVGLRVTARLAFSWVNQSKATAKAVPDFARNIDTVLIVGVNRLTNLYLRSVDDLAGGTVRVGGILSTQKGYHGRSIGSHQVLGGPADASDVIRRLEVHGVFITRLLVMAQPNALTAAERERLEQAAEKHQILLEYFSETLGFEKPKRSLPLTSVPDVRDYRLTHFAETAWRHGRRPYWVAKRMIDCVLSAALLIALAPVFLVLAILVALDVGLPVFFWQQRPGARGVPIRIFKFRTMGSAHSATGRRLSDRERISSFGSILRATRLDELPQLYNVLVGDMSFVGPRPLLPVDQFPGLEARLAIPPGITGWAQVNGGREIDAGDKAAMDIWYLKNASLWVDLKICLLTVRMVLRGERTNPAAIAAAWNLLGQAPSILHDLSTDPAPRKGTAVPSHSAHPNIVRLQKLPLRTDPSGSQAPA